MMVDNLRLEERSGGMRGPRNWCYSSLSLLYVLILKDRGEKISGTWKGPMNVPDPERIDISGSVLGKNLGDSRTNRFIIRRYIFHHNFYEYATGYNFCNNWSSTVMRAVN